jgi:hypothetical protein
VCHDARLEFCSEKLHKTGVSAALISRHKPSVPDHIDRKNGARPVLGLGAVHSARQRVNPIDNYRIMARPALKPA